MRGITYVRITVERDGMVIHETKIPTREIPHTHAASDVRIRVQTIEEETLYMTGPMPPWGDGAI